MLDKYNRNINYLRVSVTDRCNLRCVYCMPPEGIKLVGHKDTLSYQEIFEAVKYSASIGINKVRITGGEPLVRKGVTELIRMISGIHGIKDLSMTSNGILLDKYADLLADAGLNRINISLDSINPDRYSEITRGGDINMVLKGIVAAKRAGLTPIKINCVIKGSSKEKNAVEVAEFCKKNNLEIRYIHEMDIEKGSFHVVEGGTGGDCKICNRLRLSATGNLMPCLFSDQKFNIRVLGLNKAFELALENKPEAGCSAKTNKFYNTGG
jgi:GTP 3',8-cyclase